MKKNIHAIIIKNKLIKELYAFFSEHTLLAKLRHYVNRDTLLNVVKFGVNTRTFYTLHFFLLVKRLMKQRDKDSEAKSAVSAVVGKIVCTARSSGHTFSGKEIVFDVNSFKLLIPHALGLVYNWYMSRLIGLILCHQESVWFISNCRDFE